MGGAGGEVPMLKVPEESGVAGTGAFGKGGQAESSNIPSLPVNEDEQGVACPQSGSVLEVAGKRGRRGECR